MRFLLKIKHWQLFGITWGIPMIINSLAFSDPVLSFKLFPIMMAFFSLGTFGWIWAISTELQYQIPENIKLKSTKFKVIFSLPLVYLALFLIGISTTWFHSLGGQGTNLSIFEIILVLAHLLSMVCIFYGLRFAAKTLKTVEYGCPVKFSDYAGEFFLIWFSVLGFWLLQPRVNRLVGKENFKPNTV